MIYGIDIVCRNVNRVSIAGQYLVSQPLLPSLMKTLFLKDERLSILFQYMMSGVINA